MRGQKYQGSHREEGKSGTGTSWLLVRGLPMLLGLIMTTEEEGDIRAFFDRHNQNPKPFKWTTSADQILAAVKRFRQKTQQTLCSEL
jgi:hypothetical protein